MKVERTFAPMKLIIEYPEELSFFKDVLNRAMHDYRNKAGLWVRTKGDDPFLQKVEYILGKLS